MNSPHVCVLASAGTGKTHTLSSRYIELIAKGVEPRTILATTFTRKAAGEILERVLERLAEAAVDEKKRAELCEGTGLNLSRTACRDLTAKVACQIHTLHIGTIDSFFAKVMTGFALDLDVPPGWEILVDERDEDIRSLAVLRAIEGSGLERDQFAVLMRMLSSGQFKRAVHEAVLGAVNSAYGAYLPTRENPGAWEVFGAEASAPTNEDLAALIGDVKGIEIPRTQSQEPRKHWANSVAKLAESLRSRNWWDALDGGILEKIAAGESTFDRTEISADVQRIMERVLGAIGGALLALLRDRNIATRGFLQRFDAAYQAIKTDQGLMRFEDVPRAILSLGATERREEMYYRLDATIHHLLLDEFQDTSLEQFAILKPMLEELLAHTDGSRTVLCVGDVKQSLYSWRGAEPELLPALPRRWPQFAEQKLSENRRSSPVILRAVNEVFGGIAANPVVASFASARRFGEGFVEHVAHHTDMPGEVKLTVLPDNDDDDQDKQAWGARFVADRVKMLREQAPGASIAVLTRTNKPIPRLIFELRERGMSAVGERGNPLTDTPGAAAAISALHLADHPWDTAALFHVATSPLGEVLGARWRGDKKSNRVEGQWIASRLRMRVSRDGLQTVLERWQRRLAESMDALGHARFDQLIDMAGEFDESGTGRPADFVRIARKKSVEPPGLIAGGVRVMTIHAAKGLEFDAVVLPELDKKWSVMSGSVLVDRRDETNQRDPLSPVAAVTMYPSKEIQAVDRNLKELHEHTLDRIVGEELSSLYVAMTRAKRYLELIGPEVKGNQNQPTALRVLQSSSLPSGGVASPESWHTGLKAESVESRPELVVKWAATKDVPAGRLGRRSPSSLEGGPRLDLGELWRVALPSGKPEAKDRGTAFHAMFESILWLDGGTPDRKELAETATRSLPGASDSWVDEFLKQLRGDVAAVLTKTRYAGRSCELQVRREWSFALRETGANKSEHVLTGFIDRLVLGVENGKPVWAEVVDFKSDDIAEGDAVALAASVEHYRPQIEAYKQAVGALFELAPESVSACLVFSGPGRVVTV